MVHTYLKLIRPNVGAHSEGNNNTSVLRRFEGTDSLDNSHAKLKTDTIGPSRTGLEQRLVLAGVRLYNQLRSPANRRTIVLRDSTSKPIPHPDQASVLKSSEPSKEVRRKRSLSIIVQQTHKLKVVHSINDLRYRGNGCDSSKIHCPPLLLRHSSRLKKPEISL